jgi:hypothetical protein
MREYFEMEEREPLFRDTREGRRQGKIAELQRAVPELTEAAVTEAARYPEAVARIWALAARRNFTEAQNQVRLVLAAPDRDRDTLENLAGDLVELAVLYASSNEPDIYDWLRTRAIDLWYAWGSQATSGGEGAVMEGRIREMEQRIPPRP